MTYVACQYSKSVSSSKSNQLISTATNSTMQSPALPPQCNILPQNPMPSGEPNDALNSIKIQNCVATVNLGCDLNLRRINFQTRNSEYNPSRFHGVIMRIREPRCTALIFRSGKLVCTGARNEVDANLGTRKFARILQKLGYPVNFRQNKNRLLINLLKRSPLFKYQDDRYHRLY